MSIPSVSIIIVTFARPHQLRSCLESLKGQKALELILVFNGEKGDEEAFGPLIQELKFKTKILQLSSAKTPAEARNMASHFATGDWILFLDDDVVLPSDYFERAYKQIRSHSEIKVLGGPDRTPKEASFFEQSLGRTLQSPLATAHTRKRHIIPKINEQEKGTESKFILCHLWIKKELFCKHYFDPRFFRNEENVFLFKNRNENMLYDPSLFVYHERRASFFQLIPAVFKSGKFRVQSMIYYPKSFSITFFVPLFFLFYLLSLSFFQSVWALFPLVIFFLLSFYHAFRLGGLEFGPPIFTYQLVINVSYALGTFWGIVNSFSIKKKNNERSLS